MKITFKREHGDYIVTVNELPHTFASIRDALEFIFYLRNAA